MLLGNLEAYRQRLVLSGHEGKAKEQLLFDGCEGYPEDADAHRFVSEELVLLGGLEVFNELE